MGRRVRPCTVRGPLAPWAAGFEGWLAARGYSPWTVRHRVCMLADLSRWLAREGLDARDLTAERAELFVGERRAAGYSTWVSSTCVALPFAYLREVGAVPAPVTVVPQGPWVEVLAGYHEYLVRERGLAPLTVAGYERVARLFLEQLPVERGLERLTAAEVSGFLARECPRRSVSGARDLVACLRPLLRYLHVAGLIGSPLVWAVPGVADLRDRSLPRGLEPQVVSRPAGQLRPAADGRVGGITRSCCCWCGSGCAPGRSPRSQLEDLDWRRGELVVRGKRDRLDRLPLPVDVGEALVSYLQRRGASEFRAVFLRMHAPACGLDPPGGGRRGL